jgi:hypothetical protein
VPFAGGMQGVSGAIETQSAGVVAHNRLVAVILAVVWACAGVAGFVVAFIYGRWVAALVAFFALWYAVLWIRVVVQARLLTWSDVATPWRAR